MTDEVEIVTTTADTGNTYIGLRFYLESSDRLHADPEDDDRSAVTFWVGDQERGRKLLSDALSRLNSAYEMGEHGESSQTP